MTSALGNLLSYKALRYENRLQTNKVTIKKF